MCLELADWSCKFTATDISESALMIVFVLCNSDRPLGTSICNCCKWLGTLLIVSIVVCGCVECYYLHNHLGEFPM